MTASIPDLVRAHPFAAGLDDAHISLIAGCAHNVTFASGDVLCREGENADTFFLLRRGHVAVEVHAPARAPMVIETVGPGSVAGWSWLFAPYRWTFDVRAIDDVGAVAVDGACLRQKALTDPELGYALLTRVSEQLLARLQATRMRLLDLYGGRDEH